jgi:hypothetical protein
MAAVIPPGKYPRFCTTTPATLSNTTLYGDGGGLETSEIFARGKRLRYIVKGSTAKAPSVVDRLELPVEMSFCRFAGGAHPLDGIPALIAAGVGTGFMSRLAKRGVEVVICGEADPGQAVRDYVQGMSPRGGCLPPKNGMRALMERPRRGESAAIEAPLSATAVWRGSRVYRVSARQVEVG